MGSTLDTDQIPAVEVEPDCRVTYLLIRVGALSNERFVIRGEFHGDELSIYNKFKNSLYNSPLRELNHDIIGRGTMFHETTSKTFIIFSYYQYAGGFDDPKIVVNTLKRQFGDYLSEFRED